MTTDWAAMLQLELETLWRADNVGSQGVARRLGLVPLGQWWQLYEA